jgi:hypothetical protein
MTGLVPVIHAFGITPALKVVGGRAKPDHDA